MAEHLYLHVPFCRSICAYCDFCHTVYTEKQADAWLAALRKEFEVRQPAKAVRTIYIGGGTPSALSCRQLEELFSLLSPFTAGVQEYTMEANPESVTEEKAVLMRKYGIGRVSMGLQTSSGALLHVIGRRHTYEDVRQAADILRRAGIGNLSLDLMYGLPGQTMEDLRQSCLDAIALHPQHLSLYSLTVEENTVFGKKGIRPADSDLEADMYDWIAEELPRHGYRKYEISNFALPGYESQHNTAYWEYRDFCGMSCGASGKENHSRYDVVRSLAAYCRNPLARTEIPLSRADEQFEMIMMSLRMVRGMSLQRYEDAFQEPFERRFGQKAGHLIRDGLLEIRDGYVRATAYGLEILNTVLVELMDD